METAKQQSEKYYEYLKQITNNLPVSVLTDELILKTQMVAGEDWKHALTIMGFRKDIITSL